MASVTGARTYEQEQRYWVNQLADHELAFCNMYLNKTVTGYTNTQCYIMTHPRCASVQSASRCSTRMLRTYAVEKYLESMQHESISNTIMNLDELKEDLTVQVRGYDFLFEGVVSWEDTPEGRLAFVDDLAQVPERLRKYVNGYTYHADAEGYELHLREYPGKESDRNKARELLAKMQGGLIDKHDMTLRAGLPHEEISDNMSDDEAAKIYKQTMKGD